MSAGNSQDDVLRLLDGLEDLAENTHPSWAELGAHLEEFHMLTNKIRASLPEEVRRASRVANDSDKIFSAAKEEAAVVLDQARAEADRVVEEARQMAAKLIDTSEIAKMAKSQAQEMVANAEATARDVRRGADEYAREVLAAIEGHLAKVMGTLTKGREKLETRIVAQDASEPLIPVGRGIRR